MNVDTKETKMHSDVNISIYVTFVGDRRGSGNEIQLEFAILQTLSRLNVWRPG